MCFCSSSRGAESDFSSPKALLSAVKSVPEMDCPGVVSGQLVFEDHETAQDLLQFQLGVRTLASVFCKAALVIFVSGSDNFTARDSRW